MSNGQEFADRIKALARQVGFVRVGVAAADTTAGGETFRAWLEAGYQGGMTYLNRNADRRFHPSKLVPGARSVLCLAMSYAPDPSPAGDRATGGTSGRPFVARYTRGRDYHKVLKQRCRKLMSGIRRIAPEFEGRAFVDSAPIAERSLAAAAGLGWIGRNGCLIVPELGSYVVLAEIVCNLQLPHDAPIDNRCGNCDDCISACPTAACMGNSLIDSRRCLSYLTIEHRGRTDPEFWASWGFRVFGCDSCQEVCPYNRDIPLGDPELIRISEDSCGEPGRCLHGTSLADLLNWTREDWAGATCGSAARRATFEMLQRNAILAAGGSGDKALVGPLQRLRHRRVEFSELIDWALERLG